MSSLEELRGAGIRMREAPTARARQRVRSGAVVGAAFAALLAALLLSGRDPVSPDPKLETPPVAAAPPPAAAPDEPRPEDARAAARQVASLLGELLGGEAPPLQPEHLPEAINRALDPRSSYAERLAAVDWLQRFGGDAATRALERLVRTTAAPIALRVAAIDALADHPERHALLAPLLDDPRDAVRLAALRALAAGGDAESLEQLVAQLADPEASGPERADAAAALSGVPGAAARSALEDALGESGGALAQQIVAALGERGHTDSGALLRAIADDRERSPSLRVAAVDALASSGPGATSDLLELARVADAPDVRAAAAAALGLSVEPGARDSSAALLDQLASEPEASVRSALYGTLAFHARSARTRADPRSVGALALAESDPAVTLQAYRFVGSLLRAGNEPELAQSFDDSMAPWLRENAQRAGSVQERRLSIDALLLAGTPGATRALESLAHSSDAALSSQAARALAVLARSSHTR